MSHRRVPPTFWIYGRRLCWLNSKRGGEGEIAGRPRSIARCLCSRALLLSVEGKSVLHRDTAWHQWGSFEEVRHAKGLLHSSFLPLLVAVVAMHCMQGEVVERRTIREEKEEESSSLLFGVPGSVPSWLFDLGHVFTWDSMEKYTSWGQAIISCLFCI